MKRLGRALILVAAVTLLDAAWSEAAMGTQRRMVQGAIALTLLLCGFALLRMPDVDGEAAPSLRHRIARTLARFLHRLRDRR